MRVYLDNNASTPLCAPARDAIAALLADPLAHGNPSSSHPFGVAARRVVDTARTEVAALLGAPPGAVVFTSGGTESNNWAIKGVAAAAAAVGRAHIVTTTIEHPAVLETVAHAGCEVVRVGVDGRGIVSPDAVAAAVVPGKTCLVTVMHANNEIGSIQDVASIARAVRQRDDAVLVHTDASQSVGKIPVRLDDLGVDLITVAGHKLYGPKGVGALVIGPRAAGMLPKFMHGADHEAGRRAGTENVLLVAALGAASRFCAARPLPDPSVAALRNDLWQRLRAGLGDAVRLNGPTDDALRLPNTLSVSFRAIAARKLLAAIEDRVAASAGAACHSDGTGPSAVIEAMQVPAEFQGGAVRLSLSALTTADEIAFAAEELVACARGMMD